MARKRAPCCAETNARSGVLMVHHCGGTPPDGRPSALFLLLLPLSQSPLFSSASFGSRAALQLLSAADHLPLTATKRGACCSHCRFPRSNGWARACTDAALIGSRANRDPRRCVVMLPPLTPRLRSAGLLGWGTCARINACACVQARALRRPRGASCGRQWREPVGVQTELPRQRSSLGGAPFCGKGQAPECTAPKRTGPGFLSAGARCSRPPWSSGRRPGFRRTGQF